MSFEHNPSDEDREAYDNGLMVEEIKSLQEQLAAANAEIWRLKRDRNDHHYANDQLAAKLATIASIAKHLDDAAKELRCPHVLAIESVAEKAEAVCIGALTASVDRENKDATIAAQAADLLDAAMLIRRLAHRCPGLAVAHQATDWLKRKGLQGSILRETEDSNG